MRLRFLHLPKVSRFEYKPRYSKPERLAKTSGKLSLQKGSFKKYARSFNRYAEEHPRRKQEMLSYRMQKLAMVACVFAAIGSFLLLENGYIPGIAFIGIFYVLLKKARKPLKFR